MAAFLDAHQKIPNYFPTNQRSPPTTKIYPHNFGTPGRATSTTAPRQRECLKEETKAPVLWDMDASYDDRYGNLIDEQFRSVARLQLSKSSATRAVWWTGSNRRYGTSGFLLLYDIIITFLLFFCFFLFFGGEFLVDCVSATGNVKRSIGPWIHSR